MSSEALERIRELAESGRLHTWDIRPASDGHMSAVETDVSPDVLALLAEVARLEEERDEAVGQMDAALKATAQSLWDESPLHAALAVASEQALERDAAFAEVEAAASRALAALAVALEREQLLRWGLRAAMSAEPVEHSETLLRGECKWSPCAWCDARKALALVDEPAAATEACHICRRPLNEPGEMFCSAGHPLAAATLAEPEGVTGPVEASAIRQSPDPGSASAAAADDDPFSLIPRTGGE